jgi:DNA-binding response OmpR family regulator
MTSDQDFPIHLQVGDLALDRECRQARLAGQRLTLTYLEFEVLSALMERQNAVISHNDLCRTIWGRGDDRALKRLVVIISGLRRKLASLSDCRIETVRSRGYILAR